MSTDTPNSSSTADSPESRNISLTWEEDTGNWSAVDEDLGVGSVGDTREEALSNLDEAVALHTGEAGEPVTDDDLEEWGINPDSVADEATTPDAPWFDGDDA